MDVKNYDGRNLPGVWEVSFKIDGIRCERVQDGWVSKSGKPSLYGLDEHTPITKEGEIYEYFTGDWASSSAIRRHDHVCELNDLYRTWPKTDYRLVYKQIEDPSEQTILKLLDRAVEKGYEGLILKQDSSVYKVKPTETYDVKVLDIYEGLTGDNIGKMGGVITHMGKVGGGWSKDERELYWKYPEEIIGKIIEVKCQSLTPANKFRHGNKVRIRWDKQ